MKPLLLSCILGLGALAVRADTEAARPNIVVIMLDDLGYGDLGCHGAPDIRTPNIDRLAREGVRLTNAYANGPVCTPTRAALMTGRYPQRVGLERSIPAADRTIGLDATVPSLPRILKNNGYATALIGKWHLGLTLERGPNAHGFDEFFGHRAGHLDYFSHRNVTGHPDLWENEQRVEREGHMTDLIAEKSVACLERPQRSPFFLFVSFNAPHDPWQDPGAPQDIRTLPPVEKSTAEDSARRLAVWVKGDRQTYARMVEHADRGVGRILAALDRGGLSGNTLVIFTSDNGGERFSRNFPFFHQKGSLWEGGIRVPCILRWPGRLNAGTVSSQVTITMDLTATILSAARPSQTATLDGIDLIPVLSGKERPRERTLFWRYPDRAGQRAVRKGDWKYVRDRAGGNDQEFLFNLRTDEGERHTVRNAHPEILAELREQFHRWEAEVESNGAGFVH